VSSLVFHQLNEPSFPRPALSWAFLYLLDVIHKTVIPPPITGIERAAIAEGWIPGVTLKSVPPA
jgi:hypothetical protein